MKNEINRVEKAVELFSKGYNCSQAVFCAYSDIYGLDGETALKLSCGFGGGFGRMREVCGAFSALTLLAGLKYSDDDPKNKALVYEKIRLLADEFKSRNGSIICGELLGERNAPQSHIPEERTQEYMKKRPCPEIVEEAAKMVEEYILRDNLE